MILAGIGLLLLMHGMQIKSIDFINKDFQIKNLINFVKTWVSVMLFSCLYFVDFDQFSFETSKFSFLGDPLIYIVLVINFANQYLYYYAFKKNEVSLGAFNFSGFITMAAVPIISYVFVEMGFFKGALNIQYNSIYELLTFFGILLIICGYYCYGKLKLSQIQRIDLFLGCPLSGALTVVLMLKGMQMYDGMAFYMVCIMFNALMWGVFALKHKEHLDVEPRHFPVVLYCIFECVVYSQLNVLLVNLMPVEYIVICRVGVMILLASTMDYINTKSNPLKAKDMTILLALLCISTLASNYFQH